LLPLSLRAVRAIPVDRVPDAPDPSALRYFADMLASYGHDLAAHRAARAARGGFTGMATRLVTTMAPATPLDLVVLAHATPDSDPWRCAAARVAEICAGEPLVFAVSDQWAGISFTALRIARAHARLAEARNVLLILLDQGAVPYDEPTINGPIQVRDQAVGVLLGPGQACGQAVLHESRVGPEEVSAAMSAQLRRAFTGPVPVLITGPGLAALDGLPGIARDVRHASATAPVTGVWAELASELRDRHEAGIAVADYDSRRRCLWLLMLPAAKATGSRE
jgi:hypothetical protein